MKMFVEMDEKQYEEYKKLLNGDVIPKDISITKFLELKGYIATRSEQSYDLVGGSPIIMHTYEKGTFKVTLKQDLREVEDKINDRSRNKN